MKKIYALLITLAATYAVKAQSVRLSDNDGNIVNGTQMYVYQDPNDPGNTLIEADLHATNISSGSKDIKVKRRVISEVNPSSNYFCWTICYGPAQNQSPTAETIAPNATNNKFHGYCDNYGISGVTTVMYIFFDMNNTTDSSFVTVNYVGAQYTGVNNTKTPHLSDLYPNPAKDMAQIKVEGYENQSVHVKIYNMLGSVVYSTELERNKNVISLNLSSLQAGAYFYSVSANDKVIASKKLIIE